MNGDGTLPGRAQPCGTAGGADVSVSVVVVAVGGAA